MNSQVLCVIVGLYGAIVIIIIITIVPHFNMFDVLLVFVEMPQCDVYLYVVCAFCS